MAYSDQALLSVDADWINRIAACVAVEVDGLDLDVGAVGTATRISWQISAAPGFADKYASAIAGGVDHPGNDQAVISDADLTAAVQAFYAGAP